MRPHVSYSEISSFANDCQWKWKLQYLENHFIDKNSIHFDFGTACHTAIEKYLTRNNPVSTDEAVAIFITSFNELLKENRSKYSEEIPQKDIDKLLVSGERIIRELKNCEELKDAEVVHNEFRLFEDIGRENENEKIKFKGFIDLVIRKTDKRGNPVLYVCDLKTCRWGWDRDTRQDRWKHYQVFLYKYYLCKKFNIDPKFVRTAFILLKKEPPKGAPAIEFFPVSAGPVSVQRALDTLNSIVTEMFDKEATGAFEKNRKFCVDKYGNECPFLKNKKLCPE